VAQSGGACATIRAELARRNSTQSALAAHLQLSQPAVSRRMAGKVAWRVGELAAAADFFGLPASKLIDVEVVA